MNKLEFAGAVVLDGEGRLALHAVNLAVAAGLHACPACRRSVTHAATLCGFCWTRRGRGRGQPDERSVDHR